MLKRLAITTLSSLVVLGMLMAVPSSADVPVGQQVRAEQSKPASGMFKIAYKNYARDNCVHYWTGPSGATHKREKCNHGYRKVEGTLKVKLTTYKVVENLRHDVYMIYADVRNPNASGSSNLGWYDINLVTEKHRLVDSGESTAFSRDTDCAPVSVGLSAGVPGLSASASGDVNFCGGNFAELKRDKIGKARTKYTAKGMRQVRRTSITRWVRVESGKRPHFKVNIKTSQDSCTASDDGWCTRYDDVIKTRRFKIGTT
ncbi:hypothetical protein [Nocardioides euryhalodurans]|uniref:Secreted protein n=1 Tax=Nocardioides euryhalodurans TaxID=2518370 RepID=A0A4P7GGE3_9ACTN|nr:hypothetical protein [Nocardioides euryhalodurans]QBR90920.1 hypothetical protein EXE57_00535 [Nocardioides euryhalodurans]